MRVLHVNSVVNTGSTGRIVEQIGKVLLDHGNESIIAYGREVGSCKSASRLLKIGNKSNVLWHGINTVLKDNHGFAKDWSTKKFIREIDEINPDVVALYNLHGYYINIELLFQYLQRKKIPVVWTLFDCWAFTGHCSYFDNIGCEKWKTQCFECPKYDKYPKSLIDNSKFNYYNKKKVFNSLEKLQFVTHSLWLSNLVADSFLGNYKINVIPSAVDTEVFKPKDSDLVKKHGIQGKKVILGCANVWNDRKGFKDFLALAKYCKANMVIVLIGVSNVQLKMLPSNIIGIPKTESIEELAMWYSLASVFVNPTYMDNFPTTNIEALACGTPVITYDTGGSPESIDSSTGCVVRVGDIDGIWESIEELNCIDQMELSRACRERALNNYNKQTRFLEYIQVFEKSIQLNNKF